MLQLRRLGFALLTGLFLTFAGRSAHATEVGNGRDFGLGIALGDPMSFVGKVFVAQENAIDFGVGFYSWWNRCRNDNGTQVCGGGWGSLTLNADYLWQFEIVRGRKAKLDWHIGAGGRVWLVNHDQNQDLAIAGRMPVGVDLTFTKPSFIEVYLEVAPALYVYPGPGIDPEANLGVRFYF